MVLWSCHFDERLTGLNKQVNPNIKIIIENQLSEALLNLFWPHITESNTESFWKYQDSSGSVPALTKIFWSMAGQVPFTMKLGVVCLHQSPTNHCMLLIPLNPSSEEGLGSECNRAGDRFPWISHQNLQCSFCHGSLLLVFSFPCDVQQQSLIKHKSEENCPHLSNSAFWNRLSLSRNSSSVGKWIHFPWVFCRTNTNFLSFLVVYWKISERGTNFLKLSDQPCLHSSQGTIKTRQYMRATP